jgi:hypothetical protein
MRCFFSASDRMSLTVSFLAELMASISMIYRNKT